MRRIISILRCSAIVWIGMLLTALPAPAAVEDDVARDFGPLAGYVVMQENGEFIIDMDESHGVRTGDIFAVVGPGKDIVHPVTQKVLGKLETVKGILKVTRTAGGYSFTRALGQSPAPARGDAIRRYALLPAVFWDYSGGGEPLYAKLRQMLPELKWREYRQAQQRRPPRPEPTADTANALTFILDRDELVIRDPEFNELNRYPLGPAAAAPRKTAPQAPAEAVPAAPGLPATGKTPEIAPQYQQARSIAELPKTALMADFLSIDGNLWLASTDGMTIEIFQLKEKLQPVDSSRPPTPARILALKWWVPAAAKTPHLAVTAWEDNTVVGLIFRLDGNQLSPLSIRTPRILGAFDLNADGSPETLLGQDFNAATFYGERITPLELTAGDDLHAGSLAIRLPRQFTVLGSLLADLTGDGKPESVFIRNGILYIFNENQRLYKSVKKMGGTLSFLTYDVNPDAKDSKPTTAAFEISPVAVDLDADGRNELLASASERSLLGSLQVSPGLTKTWVSIFKYDNGRFTSGTVGEEFEQALQGIAFNKQRLLLVATESGDLQGQGGKSHLLAYFLSP